MENKEDTKKENVGTLQELLAELEHEQWQQWSRTLATELVLIDEFIRAGQVDSARELIERRLTCWRQNWRPYSELSEETKDHDRKWADRVIGIFKQCLVERVPRSIMIHVWRRLL